MKKGIKRAGFLLLMIVTVGFTQSCKNKNPSEVKIFVRSASNELISGAKVVIIGDLSSNPPTNEFVDTLVTNGSGFAAFDVASYYDAADKDTETAYFDIVVKTATKTGEGSIRSRVYTTAVETIFLPL